MEGDDGAAAAEFADGEFSGEPDGIDVLTSASRILSTPKTRL